MKTSKYNLIWNMNNGNKYAFNTMTCALAEVEDDFIDILDRIDRIDYAALEDSKKKLIDDMKEGMFIVEDVVDELKILKYRHFSGKHSKDELKLIIAPTLSCNFKCEYCYENSKEGFMNEETKTAICLMVEQFANEGKKVSITWYGGEPLIAKDVVLDLSESISEICADKKCNYSGSMVTNGYLLNEDVIKALIEVGIEEFQVTLDGPPETHDRRRKLKNNQPTFQVILGNIKKLRKQGASVAVRINTDKSNAYAAYELLDIFENNDMKDINISIAQVHAFTQACSSISGSCLSSEEFSKVSLDFQKKMYEKGFNVMTYTFYPGTRLNFCDADHENSYVIDPEGYIYKCWNVIGDLNSSIGNIKDFNDSFLKGMENTGVLMNHVKWMTWNPFEFKECNECNVLPVCMGGCIFNGLKHGKPQCEKWKYSLVEALQITYLYATDNIK